jgi:hypothetical protein
MTLADFFGEQGLDWKTAMQEIAAERQFAADLGIIVGVERNEGATVIDPVPTGDGGSTPPASTPEPQAAEFSERARKKKRIYKRKKSENKPTA